MKRFLFAMLLAAAQLGAASLKIALIGSKHDLSPSGTGIVTSAVPDACLFCHAPHNVSSNITPLWNQTLSTASYLTYNSSTYISGVQTPNVGSSKLCLSCHDGTVAVGLTTSIGKLPTFGSIDPNNLIGPDLTASHPLSMTPVDDGGLASTLFNTPPATKDPAVKLVGGKVECTTCHDPHMPNNDPAQPLFLTRSNANGGLCLACHDPSRGQPNFMAGWTASAHATATNTVPVGGAFAPYGNVAADACSSCHSAHNAGAPQNQKQLESAGCAPCHSGANATPALPDVIDEFNKTYAHPSMTVSGVHDPTEAIPVNNDRHAACADCHNSHASAVQVGTALPPVLPASMTGVSGYDTAGVLKPAAREYQVCYKCHGYSTNKPAASTYGRTASRYPLGPLPVGTTPTPMPSDQYNVELKFQSTISHNVAGNSVMTTTGNASLLPYMLDANKASMLNRPLTTTAQIYCVDCHDNNQARSSNGTGPNGPHGSTFAHLLAFNLYQESSPGTTSGSTAFDLCARCHNITTVQAEGVHAQGEHRSAGCTTCHDPHGVIGGNAGANYGMTNFDTAIVTKGTTYFGMVTSSGRVTCYLRCHGQLHPD